VIGTLFASAITAFILHKGTKLLGGLCETIPYVESLTFGALISSIDPIAVLSVLSNLGMTDTDTIYVVIFGESLLNDGVAMVLFQTLVHFLDESLVIDGEALMFATMHFLVVALGSVFVGFVSGMACTCYFYAMKGCQTALVEVLMFFCWALVPYYICDGVEWSGIVSIVTTGIVMDLYVVGQSNEEHGGGHFVDDALAVESVSQRKLDRKTLALLSKKGHLSSVARTHVGFVTEILSTMMETSIFAYLGFFLLSSRYHWNFWHVMMALIACCLSRAIMIPTLSLFANWITSMQQSRANCRAAVHQLRRGGSNLVTGVIIDSRMQTVLWFAGLRGAMSFALVENIPLYDAVTGEGSRMKAELKAMTSASIIFTVFVLGGCTDYVIERLGMGPSSKSETVEMTSLLSPANGTNGEGRSRERIQSDDSQRERARTTSRQRRGVRVA
jgi:NhaP-type Na+/H+ or K+/H+ antiporter